MNPDLYTEEFRNYKYLKSPPAHVEYYRQAFNEVNKIQNWATTNDPLFVWPDRIEFLEQLIDLDGKPLHIVYPGFQSPTNEYEQAPIYTIQNPIIYKGPVTNPWSGKKITMDDVTEVEKDSGTNCYLCSGLQSNSCINLYNLPVIATDSNGVTGNISIYTALFHNRNTAEMYCSAITEYIRSLRK